MLEIVIPELTQEEGLEGVREVIMLCDELDGVDIKDGGYIHELDYALNRFSLSQQGRIKISATAFMEWRNMWRADMRKVMS